MAERIKTVASALVTLCVLVAAWVYATGPGGLEAYVLPPPDKMLDAFRSAFINGTLYPHIWATLEPTLIGFVIGCALGIVIGSIVAEFRVLDMTFYPLVLAIQSLPKIAIAPLIITYLGFGIGSKITTVILICFSPVFVNTVSGIKGTNPDLMMLYRAYLASRLHVWWNVKVPAAAPLIFAGLQVAVVLALLGCIVSEFIASVAGLGFIIKSRAGQLDVAMMFVAIVVLSIMGTVAAALVRVAQRHIVFWERETSAAGAAPAGNITPGDV